MKLAISSATSMTTALPSAKANLRQLRGGFFCVVCLAAVVALEWRKDQLDEGAKDSPAQLARLLRPVGRSRERFVWAPCAQRQQDVGELVEGDQQVEDALLHCCHSSRGVLVRELVIRAE